ncbi:MAG TPA: CRISPR-associated endoribonuclease Cas6 [Thermoplasmata archaeon]|nr:CRISPR-associated endoribonuclease Cas6 [Thermoplasmata archaeon]
MRAKIFIRKIGKKPLQYDYLYALAGMLFSKLLSVDVEFAREVHSRQDFKFYTFSYIKYKKERVSQQGESRMKGLDFKEGFFILSSPDHKFIRSFCEGLLASPDFNLRGVEMCVERVEILPKVRFEDGQVVFKTLSPLYLKTLKDDGGMPVEWDLYPTDLRFYENFRLNLLKKYEAFYGSPPPEGEIQLEVIGKFKAKRHVVKGCRRRGSLLSFKLNAPSELLKFGYEAGFGEKTAMGFGCTEVVRKNSFVSQ